MPVEAERYARRRPVVDSPPMAAARARRKKPAAPRRAAARNRGRRAEQPLGVGVGDGFAVARLGMPTRLSRARTQKEVREIGWAAFGEMARQLAGRIASRFRPDLVLGIVKGGVVVGGALAGALDVEFQPVRVDQRGRGGRRPSPGRLPSLAGKRVLVVDDVAQSGKTLARARALATRAGAREVRSAVLVRRPGGSRPDWYAVETAELVVFGWDYQMEQFAGAVGDPGETGV